MGKQFLKYGCFLWALLGTAGYAMTEPITHIRVLLHRGSLPTLNKAVKGATFTAEGMQHADKHLSFLGGKLLLQTRNVLEMKGKKYTGIFILQKGMDSTYMLINQVPMELYLTGVLIGEISPSWPDEAIRAQAIAARSYAYHLTLKNRNQPYHLVSTTQAQVFHGTHDIHPTLKRNVLDTKHLILTSQKKPIMTFFHAACGGKTARPHDVWGTTRMQPLVYFQNVRCYYCKEHPSYHWEYTIARSELQNRLRSLLKPEETIRGLRIKRRSSSGRVIALDISTSTRRHISIAGVKFRQLVSPRHLKSLNFKMKVLRGTKARQTSSASFKEDRPISFIGRGYGHGIGLCQWGAKTMAERGYNAKAILRYYYKNTHLLQLKKI